MIECSRMSTPSCFARSPARDSGRTLNPIITTAVDCVPAWVAEASSTSDSVIAPTPERSEEHTSELQSQSNLVCRLLLENKKFDPDELIHANHPTSFPSGRSVFDTKTWRIRNAFVLQPSCRHNFIFLQIGDRSLRILYQ